MPEETANPTATPTNSGIDVPALSRSEAGARSFEDELDATLDEGVEQEEGSSDDAGDEGSEDKSDEGAEGEDTEGEDTDSEGSEEGTDEGEESAKAGKTEVRKALKSLEDKLKEDKGALKELKTLKSRVYTAAEFEQVFSTPEDAQGFVTDLIGLAGGSDAASALQAAKTEFQTIGAFDTMATAGDPALLDQWLKDPEEGGFGIEGFVKLMPAALEKLKSVDPAIWNHQMAQTFTSTMSQYQVFGVLDSLLENPAIKENKEASGAINWMLKLFNGIGEIAKNAPKKEFSSEYKKLEEKTKKLEEAETKAAAQRRSDRQTPVIVKALKDHSKEFIKKRKLNETEGTQFMGEVENEFARLLGKDARYIQQRNALIQAGEEDRLFNLNAAKIKKIMPEAYQNVSRKYDKFSGGKQADNEKKKSTGNKEAKGGTSGTVRVDKVDETKIDWNRMHREFGREEANDMWLFEGRFYLKGEKELRIKE